MTGKSIGYRRVSTKEQNPESQLIGIQLDKIFTETETGYSEKTRYQLENLKDYVREDDIVFVECMDRLGRNGYDLDNTVEFLLKKGAEIHFVREGIILGKKNDLMSKLAYDMMKSFIHFFSQLFKERQRIGIEKAKKEGKYKGGTKKLNAEKIEILKADLLTRKSITQIAKELGVARFTLYRYIAKIKEDGEKQNGQ
jgi:DNA invertase Pin-like site-specific DNA recombinase